MGNKINTQKSPACVCPMRGPDLVSEGKQLLAIDSYQDSAVYKRCIRKSPGQVAQCMVPLQNTMAMYVLENSSEAFVGQMLDRIQTIPGLLTQSSEEALFRVAARESLSLGTRLRAAGFIAKYSSAAAPAKVRLMTIYIALQDEIARKMLSATSEAALFTLLDTLEKIPKNAGVSLRIDEVLFNMILAHTDSPPDKGPLRGIMKRFYGYYSDRVSIDSPRFRTLRDRIQWVIGTGSKAVKFWKNEYLEDVAPAFCDKNLLAFERKKMQQAMEAQENACYSNWCDGGPL